MPGNHTASSSPQPRREEENPLFAGGSDHLPPISGNGPTPATSGAYCSLPAAVEAAMQRAQAAPRASAEKNVWNPGRQVRQVDDVNEDDIAVMPEATPARTSGNWAKAANPRPAKPDNATLASAATPLPASGTTLPRRSRIKQNPAPFPRHANSAPRPRHANNDADTPTWAARILEWASVIAIALTISVLVRTFLFQAFWIPSASMEQTLQIGDNVAATPLVPMVSELERGDVVVFQDTLGWLPPAPERHGVGKYFNDAMVFLGLRPAAGDQHLVKRIIGLPGDHVSVSPSDPRIHVNGVAVDEPYLAAGANNAAVPFDITVPPGHLWVMGDNRNNSADSRLHPDVPFVPESAVVGKVVWVTWPVSHWANPSDNAPFATVPTNVQ